MGLLIEIPLRVQEAKPLVGMAIAKPSVSRILIVGERSDETDQLKAVLHDAGIASESADNMTAGCGSAQSGRFGVIFSTLESVGGSWTRLIEVARQHDLSFEIVLLARSFDLSQWGEAMQLGAFEILDVSRDLPKAAEVVRRAFGADYLMHYRLRRKLAPV
jgi:DNA-binding NtrC family response regulator